MGSHGRMWIMQGKFTEEAGCEPVTSGCRRRQKEKEVTFDKETHGSYRAGVNRMHSPRSEETDFCSEV